MTVHSKDYREMEKWEVELINVVKGMENVVLDLIDAQFSTGGCNDRWLAIARTDLQKAFMCLIRSIAKPGDDSETEQGYSGPRTGRGMRQADPIKWDEPEKQLELELDPPEVNLGAEVRRLGLTGEGEGNY